MTRKYYDEAFDYFTHVNMSYIHVVYHALFTDV